MIGKSEPSDASYRSLEQSEHDRKTIERRQIDDRNKHRTVNNQEAGPGLYLYHIKSKEKNEESSFIGKFAIVR